MGSTSLGHERGDERARGEDLEVAFGAPVPFGTVKDNAGVGVAGDFIERERRTEEIFGEAAAADD